MGKKKDKKFVEQIAGVLSKITQKIMIKHFGHLHPKMVDEVIGVQNIQSSLVHAFCEGTKFGSILEEHGLGLDGFKKALQNTSLDSEFDFDFDTEEKSDE